MSLTDKLNNELPAIDYAPKAYSGPAKDEVIKTRRQYCNPAVFTYYKEPLMIVDGFMQYLFDQEGRRYLDLLGGIVTISCGHCHPKVLARTEEQLSRLQHASTIYLHPLLGECARKLADKMPGELNVTYFVNSGSEANDLAVTAARLFSGHFDVLALQNSYHGAVSSVMGLTSHHTWKYPLPQGQGVHHVACPDPFRSPFGECADDIANECAKDVQRTIHFETPGKVAAFIAEPIQGVGGVTTSSGNYLQQAYEITRKHGGLCIADEVQTGFGRTGDHYWGFENFGVMPDIVTMAKGIGNGVPLAAVTTRREIAEALTQRIHFNTFGGNPVSMAQGIAVLEVIDEENLQQNCAVVGSHFKQGLEILMDKHDIIGDVRGRGLMLGIELVQDRESKEPASSETAALLEELRHLSVLAGKGGLFGNVLRIKPPMCVTRQDVDYALEAMDRCLSQICS